MTLFHYSFLRGNGEDGMDEAFWGYWGSDPYGGYGEDGRLFWPIAFCFEQVVRDVNRLFWLLDRGKVIHRGTKLRYGCIRIEIVDSRRFHNLSANLQTHHRQ